MQNHKLLKANLKEISFLHRQESSKNRSIKLSRKMGITKVLQKSRRENKALLEICNDAADGWSRIQAGFLISRLSLATKFIFYAQSVIPVLAEPFAQEFDQILV